MDNPTKRRGHGGLIVLAVIVILLALICAAPFIYNAISRFTYDDYAALAAANADPADLSAADDGTGQILRLDKADVYSLLLSSGAKDRIEEALAGRATLERIGYSLSPDRAEVRMALKVLGFLPVQMQANAAVGVDSAAVRARLTDVQIGPWIRLSAEKAAGLTGVEALREPFEFSLEDYTKPLRVDRIWIENDGVALSSRLLDAVLDEVAAQAGIYPRLLRLYYGAEAPAAALALLGEGRADFLRAGCASAESMRAALRDVTAFGEEAYRASLKADLDGLPVDLGSGLDAAPAVRAAALEQIAAAQERYAESQLSLRKRYWDKQVTLTAARLLDSGGAPLEDSLPADWGARVVLMYNANYDAIVKTNEGNPRLQVPIPGLPMMSELPRDGWDALPPEGDGPFDLTLAVRMPSGDCAIVFLTPEDEFGLSLIAEETYRELVEAERLPIRAAGDLIAPRDGWLRLTGLRDGDMTPGNYAGFDK